MYFELISGALMLIGAIFMMLAAIGIVRMPDLFTRMQTTSKASTLGLSCMMLAVAFCYRDLSVISRAAAVIVFAFLTIPVGAHMIARAAYIEGVKLWDKTIVDHLKGRYDKTTHELDGRAAGRAPGPKASDPKSP
jgi:multicomponent Na+:H+ antiporter subunit G